MPSLVNMISEMRQRLSGTPTGHRAPSTEILTFPSAQVIEQLEPERQQEVLESMRLYHFGADVAAGEQPSPETAIVPVETEVPSNFTNFVNFNLQSAMGGSSFDYFYPVPYNPYTTANIDISSSQSPSWPWEAMQASPFEVVEPPSREILKRVPVDIQNLDLTDPRQKLATEAEALLGYTPLREELRTPGTLKRVLAKLEITILDEKSVYAYKKQMAKHYSTAGKMLDPTWRLTSLKDYKKPVPEYVLQKAIEIKRELPETMFYVEQLAVDPFLIVALKPLKDFVTSFHTLKRELDPEMAVYIEVWSEPKFEATM